MEMHYLEGDIVSPVNICNEYLEKQPILVLRDMTGNQKIDGFCNLFIGISGGIVLFWNNPEFLKLYDGDTNTVRYKTISSVRDFLLGTISEKELKIRIGEELVKNLKEKLSLE